MTARILLAGNDKSLTEMVRLALVEAGHEVTVAHDGAHALEQVEQEEVDLVILGIGLPQADGWDTCRRVRRVSDIPILILTTQDEEWNKLRGLRDGADICMTKPFDLSVLVAQAEALLRRCRPAGGPPRSAELSIGDLRIDLPRQEVTRAGRPIDLTPTEFRLLAALASKPGEVVAHRELLAQVWGPEYTEEERYLKLYIWYLRRKIEADPSRPRCILTKRGRGYYLAGGQPIEGAGEPGRAGSTQTLTQF